MRFYTPARAIFLGFLIFYSIIGYYFTYVLEIYHNDAISRTALAFFTVFGRDPHLAAIGFVWQPFPSFIQIPFLLLLRPFNLMLLSGPLVTAIFGAASVTIIYKIGMGLIPRQRSFLAPLIAVLFGLNPLIILYAAIGTSEMIFLMCLTLSSYYLVKFYFNHKQSEVLLGSSAIAFSFWSRYEALPAFAGAVFIILLYTLFQKTGLKKAEAILIQYILPFGYSVALWILANWLIMKDPLYFMNSPYSNASFTLAFKNNPALLEHSYHSVTDSLRYAINRSLYLAPILWMVPLIGIPLSRKAGPSLKNLLLLGFLTVPYLTIILFHSYQLFKGESFGWLRFFIYAIPMGALISLYFAKKHLVLGVFAVAIMILSLYTSFFALKSPDIGREEVSFYQKLTNPVADLNFSRTYTDQKNVAALMDTLPGNVIIDTDKGFAVPLFVKKPERFIITSDIDYLEVIGNYSAYADWIILPKPVSDDRGQNKIYEFYPGIWTGDAPNITLYREIDGWRIFQVKKQNVAIH